MRVLDLFSGIGGFSLGLHRAGFKTIAFAETDPYASRVLAARFPGVPNLGDVQTAEYPDADFISAGFPCQDISNAGRGAGLAGERSGLWREVVRALRMVRPRGALLENVAALLNRGLGTVLGDLAEVGYDAEWHCIPASAVGAPHRRDRIWIYCAPDSPPVLGASIFGCQPNGNHARAGEVANAASAISNRVGAEPHGQSDGPANGGEAPADPIGLGQPGPWQSFDAGDQEADREGQASDAVHAGIGNIWRAEPNVGRVAHGVPARVDRLRCLGNAVVPQIPELIGRAILASIAEQAEAA